MIWVSITCFQILFYALSKWRYEKCCAEICNDPAYSFRVVLVIPRRHILSTPFAWAVGCFLISQGRRGCFSSGYGTLISNRQARDLHSYRLTQMFISSTRFGREWLVILHFTVGSGEEFPFKSRLEFINSSLSKTNNKTWSKKLLLLTH